MEKKIKVLCVDDNPDWCEVLKDIISRTNYKVETVSSYVEAIQKLERSTFHVVLLDLRLEDFDERNIDGLKIAEMINRLDEGTKTIIFTAYMESNNMRKAFGEFQIWDFIAKQDAPSAIVDAVKSASEKAEMELNRPSRFSKNVLTISTETLEQFITAVVSRNELSNNAEHLELFAKRLLRDFHPLLPDKKDVQIVSAEQNAILQIRFWSKMYGSPIIVWIGKYDEMENILQSSKVGRSSSGQGQILATLFDRYAFADLGGIVFENKDSNFDQYEL